MTFIDAIQHMTIGYRVYRRAWSSNKYCRIFMNQDRKLQWVPGNASSSEEVGLCPDPYDPDTDLIAEDINADDWEVVR